MPSVFQNKSLVPHTEPEPKAQSPEASLKEALDKETLAGRNLGVPIDAATRTMADALLLGSENRRSAQIHNAEKVLNSAQNTAMKAGLKGLIALSRVQSEIEDQHIDNQRRLQMTGPSRVSQGYNPCKLIEELLEDMRELGADVLVSQREVGLRSARESLRWASSVLARASALAKKLSRKTLWSKQKGVDNTAETLDTELQGADTVISGASDYQLISELELESLEETLDKKMERLREVYRLQLEDDDENSEANL